MNNRKNKVLFIEAINKSPHIETSFELVDIEKKKGNHVSFYFIGHALAIPSNWGITMKRKWWNSWFLPENRAARMVPPDIFYNVKKLNNVRLNHELILDDSHKDIRCMLKFEYDNLNIGQCILGDYINYKRKYSIDTSDDRHLIVQLTKNAVQVIEFLNQVFKRNRYDKVYIFNGRFTFSNPILNFCKKNNITYYIHERGSEMSKYFLEKYTPHDIKSISNKIESIVLDNPIDISIAHDFFRNKRNGLELGWVSFRKETDPSIFKLPGRDITNVVFYTSSEFEFEAVADQNPRNFNFPDQIHALRSLTELCKKLKYRLIVRVHPNMSNSNELLVDLQKLSSLSNMIVYWPNDQVNSYDLLDIADLVVTYGSTMGIEAVYWGKPCILLGRAYYEKLKGVLIPKDNLDLEHCLMGYRTLVEAKTEYALPYGFYAATFGNSFNLYKPGNLHKGIFIGRDLQKSYVVTKVNKII